MVKSREKGKEKGNGKKAMYSKKLTRTCNNMARRHECEESKRAREKKRKKGVMKERRKEESKEGREKQTNNKKEKRNKTASKLVKRLPFMGGPNSTSF